MRLAATIEVEGTVSALGRGADPPRDGVSFRNDGEAPKTLYVNGVEVGELVDWPKRADVEEIRDHGGLRYSLVHAWRLDCWLELPHRDDRP